MPRSALEWPALKVLANKVTVRESWKSMCGRVGLKEWVALRVEASSFEM